MSPGPLLRAAALVSVFLYTTLSFAQQPNGSIAGIVTDPSGAVVAGARVSVLSKATAHTIELTTTRGGVYLASGLLSGQYEVSIQASGFRRAVLEVTVEVGRVTNADVRLQVGATADAVTVRADEVRVNPTQSGLEGVVTERLIRDLPLNGRNLLDLGQLEPGVQLNPSDWNAKPGYVRLAFAGQSGVTTRVTVDGIDASDESFGSVTANLSTDAIKEFQVSRTNFDASTGLTGSGAVNVVTRSGSNDVHGTAFLFWRDDALAARIGEQAAPFDREQFGFSVGGPFVRDRLFWSASYERNNQDAAATTTFALFPQYSRTWQVPADERSALGRVDWNVTRNLRFFSRFSHYWSDATSDIGGVQLDPVAWSSRTNQTMAGLELTAGRFTHSGRFGYTDYDNIQSLAAGKIPGLPVITDSKGRPVRVVLSGGGGNIGANGDAPVLRHQDNYEARYDGGVSYGRHSLRWGALTNRISLNWFAPINALAPAITLTVTPATIATCTTAGRKNDLACYPAEGVGIGNGLGYWTERPSHGLPFGGFFNNRFHWYAADSWRVSPRLNISLGLRWVYEPGPNNTDLSKPREFLDAFLPGQGRPNRRDRNNFAPQFGFAWDPTGRGKWTVRAAAGVFYDINLMKHIIFERHSLLPPGIIQENVNVFNRDAVHPLTGDVILRINNQFITKYCQAGVANRCELSDPGFLEAVWDGMEEFRAAHRAAAAVWSPSGLSRAERGRGIAAINAFFDPDYATPYSIHFNLGVQRELRRGLVLSADYVRVRGLKSLLRHDLNRVGAADTLDVARAQAAMNGVQAPLGCTQPGSAGVECALTANPNLRIGNYLSNGLGIGQAATLNPTTGAVVPSLSGFPGMNPAFNRMERLETKGISTYDGLHVNLRGRLPDFSRFAKEASAVASYAWGRLEGIGFEDQALYNTADRLFNDDPRAFRGPMNLDRTHMLTVSGIFTAPGGVRLSSIWRASSALPQSLVVPAVGMANREIFFTDYNGDGFAPDPLPGTTRGDYGRRLGCGAAAINRAIDRYNDTQAGRLTPAGQALVDAGLFTSAQLITLGAVSPTVQRAPERQLCLDSFLTADVRISRPFKLGERFTLEPALEWFNLFNVANFDLPGDRLGASLNGTAGSLNGTPAGSNPFRAGAAVGSFALGAPRSWQLMVRISF